MGVAEGAGEGNTHRHTHPSASQSVALAKWGPASATLNHPPLPTHPQEKRGMAKGVGTGPPSSNSSLLRPLIVGRVE